MGVSTTMITSRIPPANGEEGEAHVGEALTTSTNGKESQPLPAVGWKRMTKPERSNRTAMVRDSSSGEGTRTRRRSRRRNLKARVNRRSSRV